MNSVGSKVHDISKPLLEEEEKSWTSKILRLLAKALGAAAMIALFFWQASVAVDKYQSKLTSLQVNLSSRF